jgi:hypothetical protein
MQGYARQALKPAVVSREYGKCGDRIGLKNRESQGRIRQWMESPFLG